MQRIVYRSVAQIVNGIGLGKTHFRFLRVNIDVHFVGRHHHVQHKKRVFSRHEIRLVRLSDNSRQSLIVHITPVYRKHLVGAVCLGVVGCADVSVHFHVVAMFVNLYAICNAIVSVNGKHSTFQAAAAAIVNRRTVANVPHFHVRIGKDKLCHVFGNFHTFFLRRFEKLSACRCVEKQVTHLDFRACYRRRVIFGCGFAVFDFHAYGARGVFRLGGQPNMRHSRNTAQCFPAEAKRFHVVQVVDYGDFACSVFQKRRLDLVFVNSAAVVRNGNKPETNAVCACVNAVFNQFLYRADGAFHHFASRNLVVNIGC